MSIGMLLSLQASGAPLKMAPSDENATILSESIECCSQPRRFLRRILCRSVQASVVDRILTRIMMLIRCPGTKSFTPRVCRYGKMECSYPYLTLPLLTAQPT